MSAGQSCRRAALPPHHREGTKPLTDLADSRRDLALMVEIIDRMKDSGQR
jgi:virulence factor